MSADSRDDTAPLDILVVDDEPAQRAVLTGYLRKRNYPVREAGSVAEARRQLEAASAQVVFTDFRMTDGTGLDLLRHIRSEYPDTAVVLITAFGSIEGAVEAMRAGAYDYLSKPVDLDELELLLGRIAERRSLISENRMLREQLTERYAFTGFVSVSSAMERVLNTAARVARSKASVLIRGESGTGKEVLARAIHVNGQRSSAPFVAVNCAALNEHLLESELFGHEKGAFTGADRQRHGRFEAAHGGTLFLDEIGDISPGTQVKLLRVLQEQTFERVGGNETLHVDVRLIAATNRPLEDLIARGQFREDLFYRLNVVSIDIPPLRERREDIAPILQHYLAVYATENGRENLSFSSEAWDALQRYPYPGNVRELQNIVHRAVILSRGNVLRTTELPPGVGVLQSEHARSEETDPQDLPGQVERLERRLVLEALRQHNDNRTQAARRLGISERNLRYRLKKWGLG